MKKQNKDETAAPEKTDAPADQAPAKEPEAKTDTDTPPAAKENGQDNNPADAKLTTLPHLENYLLTLCGGNLEAAFGIICTLKERIRTRYNVGVMQPIIAQEIKMYQQHMQRLKDAAKNDMEKH